MSLLDPPGDSFRPITPEELAFAHGPSVTERAIQLVTTQREKLYWKMVSEGKLPSQGWKIAERLNIGAFVITYTCWPYKSGSNPSGAKSE